MNSLISIIIPVYNGERLITETISSIKSQTHTNFEVIIVNDGSTDNTHAKLTEAIDGDTRFKIITKKNGGVSSARNRGIQEAQGDYFFFLDADDLLGPETLEVLLNTIHEPDNIIACNVARFSETTDTAKIKPIVQKAISSSDYIDGLLLGRIPAYMCGLLIPKELIVSKKLREDLSHGEDLLFLIQMLSEKNGVAVVPASVNAIYYYRAHENAATARMNTKSIISNLRKYHYIHKYKAVRKSVLFRSYTMQIWTLIRNTLRDPNNTISDCTDLLLVIEKNMDKNNHLLFHLLLHPKELLQYLLSLLLIVSARKFKSLGIATIRKKYGIKF